MADAVTAGKRSLTPEGRLELARGLEERQRHGDALLAYYRAIIEAQRQGRWLDKATPAAEREAVSVLAGAMTGFNEAAGI